MNKAHHKLGFPLHMEISQERHLNHLLQHTLNMVLVGLNSYMQMEKR